jgi:hypothetical protein
MRRNNGIPTLETLVFQFHTFQEIAPVVEGRISERFGHKEISCLSLKLEGYLSTPPRLIVIDSLDECENPDIKCELLRAIARAIPDIPYLQSLIASLPET